MSNQSSISKATMLTLLVGFLGGGFVGSVFTWYVNRPKSTVLTYSVSTTPWAAPEAASLIPNLKVQIENESIKALYAHSIDFGVPSGPHAEKVDVAITYPNRIRIYGKSAEAPSRVHSISCAELEDGVRCTMSPLAPGSPRSYRVVIATDEKQAPTVIVAAKGIELQSLQEFLGREKFSPSIESLLAVMAAVMTVGIIFGQVAVHLLDVFLRDRGHKKESS